MLYTGLRGRLVYMRPYRDLYFPILPSLVVGYSPKCRQFGRSRHSRRLRADTAARAYIEGINLPQNDAGSSGRAWW
jgi:hypothetical protein